MNHADSTPNPDNIPKEYIEREYGFKLNLDITPQEWLTELDNSRQARGVLANTDGTECCMGVLARMCGYPKDYLMHQSTCWPNRVSTAGIYMPMPEWLDDQTVNDIASKNDESDGYPIEFIKEYLGLEA